MRKREKFIDHAQKLIEHAQKLNLNFSTIGWLVQVKRYDEAINVLKRVRGTGDVKEEFKEIKNECEEAEKMAAQSCISSLGDAFANKCSRRALVVGCVLWATHEFSGINVMMYYTATIVQMSGVYDKTLAVW